MRPSAFYFGHRVNRLTSAGGTPERSKFASFLAVYVWHTNDELDVIYRQSA